MRFPTPPSTGSPLAPQPEVNKSLRPRGRAKSAPVKFILVHKETTQLQAGFYQPLGSSRTLRLNLNTSAESLLPLWGACRRKPVAPFRPGVGSNLLAVQFHRGAPDRPIR